jgi:hypothetical protein
MAAGNPPALANIYTWTDGENHRHFTNREPPPDARGVTLYLKCPPPRSEDFHPEKASAEVQKEDVNASAPQEAQAEIEAPEILPEESEYPDAAARSDSDVAPTGSRPAEAVVVREKPYEPAAEPDPEAAHRILLNGDHAVYRGSGRHVRHGRYGLGHSRYRPYRKHHDDRKYRRQRAYRHYRRYQQHWKYPKYRHDRHSRRPYGNHRYTGPVKKHERHRHHYKSPWKRKIYRSKPHLHKGRGHDFRGHRQRSVVRRGFRSHGSSFNAGHRR